MLQREDVVAYAVGQVGTLSGQGYDHDNPYSRALGLPGEAWCGDFVTTGFWKAGIPLPSMQPGHWTGFSYVPAAYAYGLAHGLRRNSWEAEPGDIICFDWSESGSCTGSRTHSGIVRANSGGTLLTIEGNSGPNGGVNSHTWSAPAGRGNPQIAGVLDASRLVVFGASSRGQDHGNAPDAPDAPPWPGRLLLLKSPHLVGDDVTTWQQRCLDDGFELGASQADGEYGPISESICRLVQQLSALTVDGVVGPQTWPATWTCRAPSLPAQSNPAITAAPVGLGLPPASTSAAQPFASAISFAATPTREELS